MKAINNLGKLTVAIVLTILFFGMAILFANVTYSLIEDRFIVEIVKPEFMCYLDSNRENYTQIDSANLENTAQLKSTNREGSTQTGTDKYPDKNNSPLPNTLGLTDGNIKLMFEPETVFRWPWRGMYPGHQKSIIETLCGGDSKQKRRVIGSPFNVSITKIEHRSSGNKEFRWSLRGSLSCRIDISKDFEDEQFLHGKYMENVRFEIENSRMHQHFDSAYSHIKSIRSMTDSLSKAIERYEWKVAGFPQIQENWLYWVSALIAFIIVLFTGYIFIRVLLSPDITESDHWSRKYYIRLLTRLTGRNIQELNASSSTKDEQLEEVDKAETSVNGNGSMSLIRRIELHDFLVGSVIATAALLLSIFALYKQQEGEDDVLKKLTKTVAKLKSINESTHKIGNDLNDNVKKWLFTFSSG